MGRARGGFGLPAGLTRCAADWNDARPQGARKSPRHGPGTGRERIDRAARRAIGGPGRNRARSRIAPDKQHPADTRHPQAAEQNIPSGYTRPPVNTPCFGFGAPGSRSHALGPSQVADVQHGGRLAELHRAMGGGRGLPVRPHARRGPGRVSLRRRIDRSRVPADAGAARGRVPAARGRGAEGCTGRRGRRAV